MTNMFSRFSNPAKFEALAKTGAPVPTRQLNEAIGKSKEAFKGIDTFVFSLTLGDQTNRIVTTPCYMLDARVDQIAEGAENLVKAILEMS